MLDATSGCRNILIVDETRRTGGLADALMTNYTENDAVAEGRGLARVSAQDSFIPTGPAYAVTMPSVDEIMTAATALVGGKS